MPSLRNLPRICSSLVPFILVTIFDISFSTKNFLSGNTELSGFNLFAIILFTSSIVRFTLFPFTNLDFGILSSRPVLFSSITGLPLSSSTTTFLTFFTSLSIFTAAAASVICLIIDALFNPFKSSDAIAVKNSTTPFPAVVLENNLSDGAETSARYILPPLSAIILFKLLAIELAALAVLAQKYPSSWNLTG